MKCLITDKTLEVLKTLQENLEERLVSKKQAALTLKYAIEDIEAQELDICYEDEIKSSDKIGRKVFVAAYTPAARSVL